MSKQGFDMGPICWLDGRDNEINIKDIIRGLQ